MPRKAVPTVLKIIRGTAQPCRMNKKEAKPNADNIDMPAGMSEAAQQQWIPVAQQLEEAGLLTNLDVQALRMYCEAYAVWLAANDKIIEFGAVLQNPEGRYVRAPWFDISAKAFEQMHKMIVEFGMTPASRTKVSASKPEKKKADDPWADL